MPSATPRRTNPRVNPDHAFIVGRFGIIFIITAFVAFAIAVMLFRTTVIHASDWNRMGTSTLADSSTVMPFRGEILASDGSILATNLYYYNLMMDLRAEGFKIIEFNEALPALCDSLAKYFPTRTAAGWREKFDAQLAKPKAKRSRNFVIAKAVPKEICDYIRTKFPFFKDFNSSNKHGLKADQVLKRAYPFGSMARLSIGRVGQTEECSEVHGRSGLECALDTLLYGVPGLKVKRLSTSGYKYVVERPAIDGYDVLTTIDITMQDILENELNDMLLASKAEWGAAMLMEVATGDIKAMSNLELDTKAPTPRYIEALNRCVEAYEPGSVMKVMTMAVALEKGFAKPVTRTYPIGRSFRYLNNRPINDTHSPGSLPISRFIEYSSNIGMVKMTMPHYEGNTEQFRNDLAELGFFTPFHTGIARERVPFFRHNPAKIDLSRMVFGYATQIPPLYTCAFYNAVANGGDFVRPRLVKGLRLPDGRDSIIPVSRVRPDRRMMTEENAAILRQMMHGVVWGEGGTAKVLKNDVVEIAGKTGTCKIALEDKRPRVDADGNPIKLPPFRGGYLEGHYRVTFCGFFPYENPKYTCIVVINDPKMPYRGPAVSAGTVLKNVALKLYARSMLDDNPVFVESPNASSLPTLYSSFDDTRINTFGNSIGVRRARRTHHPAENDTANRVPDVRGVALREALAKLEGSGYAVDFDGVGYVATQDPMPGAAVARGTKVKLTLKHD